MVAYWKFEEGSGLTVSDSSGNGHILTLNNFNYDANSGWNGGSLLFDGVNDVATTPDSPDLNFSTAFTIESWIRANSVQLTEDQGIISKWNGNGYLVQMLGGKINNLINGSNSNLTTGDLRDDSWHHIAVVWNGVSRFTYIDGLLEATDVTSPSPNSNNEPLIIGNYLSMNRYFRGNIDEVKIYNTARSQTEIQTDAGVPVGAGSVVINEIMWPGSITYPADEWIELKNMTAEAIDLSSWKIENLGGVSNSNITIPTGIIGSNSFFLISNYTKDNSIIDVDADYTVPSISLLNSGEQLILKNDNGATIDTANTDSGWFAGENGTPNKSMSRKNPSGNGSASTSWFTSTGALNLDTTATELATPKANNN